MEGSDGKMSWLIFASVHSFPGDALAAGRGTLPFERSILDAVNPVILSEILSLVAPRL